ncbi:hypothetical protein LTR37_014827 [Vermiconidia calcicola]|uniref:Uncharacterized protein n=1 Tax=Vermiconidia calcicola TaxID=1690605 RepID=A0ACC3MU52_9PEZI|nr:hypothetical protein LTR37_014827 [Vermiconidia calcicola]
MNGRSKTNAAFVMEAMTQKYLSGASRKWTWIYGALIADLLNLGKITKETWCLRETDCSKMMFTHDNYRVCHPCSGKEDHVDEDFSSGKLRLQKIVRNLGLRLQKTSAGTDYPFSKEVSKAHSARILQPCEQVFDKSQRAYEDAYAKGKLRQDRVIESQVGARRRKRTPFAVSLGGVFPGTEEEAKLYHHAPDNCTLTAEYLNMTKNVWVPALLQILRDYRQLVELAEDDETSSEVQQVYAKLDHIYVVTCLLPKKVRRRLTKDIRKQYVKLLKQWRKGEADPGANPLRLWDPGFHVVPEASWEPPRLTQMEHMITQMEHKFGRKVPRHKASGAPWLWLPEHQPHWWGWRNLYRLMGDRLERLNDWFHWQHQHFDESAETLLIECIRQYLEYGGRDTFFGLRMTIWARHPLCFVVAHSVHGQKIRTGCKTADPSDYDQDYDANLSNTSFEPQVSNWAKQNYDEKYYEDMLTDILSVDIPTQYYERPSQPVQPIAQLALLRKAEQLTHDDEDSDDEDESDNDAEDGEGEGGEEHDEADEAKSGPSK